MKWFCWRELFAQVSVSRFRGPWSVRLGALSLLFSCFATCPISSFGIFLAEPRIIRFLPVRDTGNVSNADEFG